MLSRNQRSDTCDHPSAAPRALLQPEGAQPHPRRALRSLAPALLGSVAIACSGGPDPAIASFSAEAESGAGPTASYQPSFLPLASSGRAETESTELSGVFPVIDQRWVALASADDAWGVGEPWLQSPDQPELGGAGAGVLTLTRALGAGQLPAGWAELAGSRVVLGGPNAAAGCSATLGAVEILRRLEPDFGLDADDAPRVGSAAFVSQAWRRGAGFGVLVAELQHVDPGCADAGYAHFSTAADLEVAERTRPDPDDLRVYRLAQQAYVGLRQLPAYGRLQQEYADFIASPGAEATSLADESAWESHGAAQPELAFYGGGEPRFIGWQLKSGEGCGDFYGNLSVLYQVLGAGEGAELRLVDLSEASDLPQRVVLSGGGIQLLDASGLRQAGADRTYLPLEIPAFGCPC